MPEFYIIIARKIFFPIFLGGGRLRQTATVPIPPAPTVSYTYGNCLEPIRANTSAGT